MNRPNHVCPWSEKVRILRGLNTGDCCGCSGVGRVIYDASGQDPWDGREGDCDICGGSGRDPK